MLPLLLATGCGAGGTAAPSRVEPPAAETTKGPQKLDIPAMFQREAGELASQTVSAPDGRWTASPLGQSPPRVAATEDNAVIVEIPIGSSLPVHCQVFYEAVDSAGTINQMLGAAAQNVQFQRVVPWAITVDNDYPTAWVEATYLVDQANGKAAGHLKLAISARDDYPLLCVHDEVGYKESFRRVAQAFFRSFEPAQKSAEPIYLEVFVEDIDTVSVGFWRAVLTQESDGRQRWTTTSMTMQPVGLAELRLEDDYRIEIIDAQKRLVSGHWVEAAAGELTLNIELERGEGNLYRYAGQLQGKPVEGSFRTKSPHGLPSDILIADTLVEHLAQPRSFFFSREAYLPSADPTAPQEFTYHHDAGDPPRVVKMKLGAIDIQGVMDERGMASELHAQMGQHQLRFRRVVQRGNP